jgi:hypothetical protein
MASIPYFFISPSCRIFIIFKVQKHSYEPKIDTLSSYSIAIPNISASQLWMEIAQGWMDRPAFHDEKPGYRRSVSHINI